MAYSTIVADPLETHIMSLTKLIGEIADRLNHDIAAEAVALGCHSHLVDDIKSLMIHHPDFQFNTTVLKWKAIQALHDILISTDLCPENKIIALFHKLHAEEDKVNNALMKDGEKNIGHWQPSSKNIPGKILAAHQEFLKQKAAKDHAAKMTMEIKATQTLTLAAKSLRELQNRLAVYKKKVLSHVDKSIQNHLDEMHSEEERNHWRLQKIDEDHTSAEFKALQIIKSQQQAINLLLAVEMTDMPASAVVEDMRYKLDHPPRQSEIDDEDAFIPTFYDTTLKDILNLSVDDKFKPPVLTIGFYAAIKKIGTEMDSLLPKRLNPLTESALDKTRSGFRRLSLAE